MEKEQHSLDTLTTTTTKLLNTSQTDHTIITTALQNITQRSHLIGRDIGEKMKRLLQVKNEVIAVQKEVVCAEECLVFSKQCLSGMKPVGIDKDVAEQQLQDMEVQIIIYTQK